MEQMEDLCSPFSWGCFYQEEGVEELRHSLLYTTIEFETTLISAKEEITKREFELVRMKDLLSKTEKERDEARAKCKRLLQEQQTLQHELHQMQQQPKQQESIVLNNEERDSKGSNCSENITSPSLIPLPQCNSSSSASSSSSSSSLPDAVMKLAGNKPLPEKGKLLQAVMEAGPLLQTLLLAGPLPQWQHPPPQLDSTEIPPVGISSVASRTFHHDSFSCISTDVGCVVKKGNLVACDASDHSSPRSKCQKVIFH